MLETFRWWRKKKSRQQKQAFQNLHGTVDPCLVTIGPPRLGGWGGAWVSLSPEWWVLSWLQTDTLRASLLPSSCESLHAAAARANTGEDDWMETPPQRSQQDSFYGCLRQQLLSIDCTDSYTALFLRLSEIWYPAKRVFIQNLDDIIDCNKIVWTQQCVMFLSSCVTAPLPFLSQ